MNVKIAQTLVLNVYGIVQALRQAQGLQVREVDTPAAGVDATGAV